MSSRAALGEVLELLPNLTSTGLLEVHKRVNALLQLTGYKGELDEEDWILDGIKFEIGKRGLGQTIPPRFKITKPQHFYGYLAKAERVRSTLDEAIPGLSKIQKQALGQMAARILADYIDKFRPLTFTSMLNSVHLIINAVEDAFPGYIQSKLLRFALLPRELVNLD